ncbi:hypothetical protein IW261DRAFT_453444 [Armillaria novae-zelandiae]|uniref:Uncharacterized protein n=1 Tax=Armillaria novae-zelandiae TaxID=153914 RepID=A0AA39P1U2_9AGAR|nr:hypothetical protein IW261DRAFT_453444 [Armillaria novae-zelandiae]
MGHLSRLAILFSLCCPNDTCLHTIVLNFKNSLLGSNTVNVFYAVAGRRGYQSRTLPFLHVISQSFSAKIEQTWHRLIVTIDLRQASIAPFLPPHATPPIVVRRSGARKPRIIKVAAHRKLAYRQ